MIGIGIGINRNRYAQGIFNAYSARVVADGGVVESGSCVDAVSSLLQSASLLLIPSGYKEDIVYSQIPTDGSGDLSFTRASNGTRVNSAGLVEDCPWNLAQYSEDFTNGVWVKSRTTITSNATNAPNGTLTADKFIATSASGVHTISQSGFASEAYSFSVYAKAGEETVISLWLRSAAVGATFDLSAGTVSNITVTSATITDVGDGWYRCFVYDSTPGTTANIYGKTGSSYVGNGVDGFFIWGAQLVEGTTAQTYLPTTDRLNFPRLSYMYGSCPSLLLEPQRTNLLPNQLSYNTATGVAYSTSVTDSPVIGLNSTRITKNEASGTLRYGNQICSSSALAGSTTYTISAYFKYDGYAVTTTMEYNNSLQWGGTSWNQIINIASTGVTLGSSSSCTGSVQNVGNGWYRVSVTITTGASISGGTPVSYLMQVASTLSTGQGFLQAAPQFEVGAYSTTPILTSGASATRVADTATVTGASSLIGQSAGTIFWDITDISGTPTGTGNPDFGVRNTAFTNWVGITTNGFNSPFRVTVRPTTGSIIDYTANITRAKACVAWSSAGAVLYVNGTQVATSAVNPNFSFDRVDMLGGLISFRTNQFALFTTRLTDAQLATLTTL